MTGSDTRPNRNLSKSLALQHNLVGEGVVSNASVVKTHFPERIGYKKFRASRVLLLVRNPYDAIDSYWNLCLTNTHTETVADEVYERFESKFVGLVRHEIRIWLEFHQYWLKAKVPVLVVRFEDLVLNPEGEMCRVVKFINGQDCLSDFWVERIRHACGSTHSSTASLGSYRPRSADSGKAAIGKSIRKGRYSKDLLGYFEKAAQEHTSGCGNLLHRFGYDMVQQGFPDAFVTAPHQHIGNDNKTDQWVRVNAGPELRSIDDPYGRAMTPWRRSFTDNDSVPFPTVSRNN